MAIRVFNIDGKKYPVKTSNKDGKKYKVEVEDETLHFGSSNYKIAPGTEKGDNYCARSYGLGKEHGVLGDKTSKNFWSRKMWNCKGKKSMR